VDDAVALLLSWVQRKWGVLCCQLNFRLFTLLCRIVARDEDPGSEGGRLVPSTSPVIWWRCHEVPPYKGECGGVAAGDRMPSSSGECGRKDCPPRVLGVPSEPGAASIERNHTDVAGFYPVTCGFHFG
jgi:hypothetical protein